VVLDQLVKFVSLALVERPVEAVVVLDFLIENGLDRGLGLPGALGVGQRFPFHEIKLINVVLVPDGIVDLLLSEVLAHSHVLLTFVCIQQP
jgi:hypothetical protein